MTDPNLRRLLDIAARKNPLKSLNHAVMKRHHQPADLVSKLSHSARRDFPVSSVARLLQIAETLESQDANNLGLDVIWVDDFREIPLLLRELRFP
jgi:hypothetical protein